MSTLHRGGPLPTRTTPIGPGGTPGSVPGPRPSIPSRPSTSSTPSTPSNRDASVGGPPRREPSAALASAAQRPRSPGLPPPTRRDGAAGEGGGNSQALVLHSQAGGAGVPPKLPPRPGLMPGRPQPNLALTRPTLGGLKPIGQGGHAQAQATAATSGPGEGGPELADLLDQLDQASHQLRELAKSADHDDAKKVMEEFGKILDMFKELNEKLNQQMISLGQSFAQSAQAQPQG